MTLVHKELGRLQEPNTYAYNGGREKQSIQDATAYFVNDDSVVMERSRLVTGLNKHSNNRYYRWERYGKFVVIRTKRGKFHGYLKNGRAYRSFVPSHVGNLDAKLADLATEKFGELTVARVYPLAEHFALTMSGAESGRVYAALKEDTVQDMTKLLFGVKRYRKDLVKAVAESNLVHISAAVDLRGMVPTDWLINYLRVEPVNPVMPTTTIPSIRPTLRAIDDRSYRYLTRINDLRPNTLQDIWRMQAQQYNHFAGRARTWTELHDGLMGGRRRHEFVPHPEYAAHRPASLRSSPKREIERTWLGEKLNGLVIDKYRIVTPDHRDILDQWSTDMHNCISSYGYEVVKDEPTMVLGGVYEGDTLIANFEIREDVLRQLLGKYNRTLDKELRDKIITGLSSQGVVVGEYLIDGDGW